MNPTSPQSSSTVETEEVIQRLQKKLENLQQRLKACEFSNAVRIAAADGSSTDFNPHWYEYTGLSAVESCIVGNFLKLFTNLIGNCLKHHPRIDGKVQISVQDPCSFYEFALTDDGSGIAPQYHEKVFGIFQTLEARDKSENTGIGLAIVKKIVESQGGIIRLESQEEKGATFRFTWSK